MKNSFVIYTALFGDYDELLEPKEKYPECDFVCFTDQIDLTSSIWKVIIVKPNNLSSNILNRRYKWLPHLYLKEYEVSMYIDSSILVLNNPINLVHKYFYSSDRLIAISRHPDRNCIYDESIACLDYHKSKFFDTLKQMIFYKKSGFPKNFGLSANGVIIRKHNSAEIIKLMEDFWVEFNCWNSKRDQLSFYYIIWKN
ncbi:MAG: DUF616 domain-containing protein, partial [bacterium]|nr:DUF616 domain-containing protein [bacterium]